MSTDNAMMNAFEAFEAYDFENDRKFSSGWENIRKTLGNDEAQDHVEGKLLEAKIFYFSKFYHPIKIKEYKDWAATKEEKIPSKEMDKENSLSFSEVIELIEKGEKLPGIEELNIKPTHTGFTRSKIDRMKKPWEG